MLEAGLTSRARRLYEQLLQKNRRDAAALGGAGRAAFELGDYRAAESLLSRAAAAGATGEPFASTLSLARSIVQLDPYQRGLTTRARLARAREALDIAFARLDACAADRSDPRLLPLGDEVATQRTALARPTRDPDVLDAAMELVFRVEQITAAVCGEPQGPDLALLLIARQRAGGAP
jgi:tetratricopeptide (TPR) repeat protein